MSKKQKSGLYRSKIKIGVDEQGKDVYKWFSGRTRRELEEARQRIIETYIEGTGLSDDRLFGPYAQDWYHLRKEPFVAAAKLIGSSYHKIPCISRFSRFCSIPFTSKKVAPKLHQKSRGPRPGSPFI